MCMMCVENFEERHTDFGDEHQKGLDYLTTNGDDLEEIP